MNALFSLYSYDTALSTGQAPCSSYIESVWIMDIIIIFIIILLKDEGFDSDSFWGWEWNSLDTTKKSADLVTVIRWSIACPIQNWNQQYTTLCTIIMSSNRQQVRTARPWNAGNPTQPPLPCPTPFTFNSAPGLFGFVTRWHCKVANLMGTRFRIVVRIYFFWILILLKIFSSYLMI